MKLTTKLGELVGSPIEFREFFAQVEAMQSQMYVPFADSNKTNSPPIPPMIPNDRLGIKKKYVLFESKHHAKVAKLAALVREKYKNTKFISDNKWDFTTMANGAIAIRQRTSNNLNRYFHNELAPSHNQRAMKRERRKLYDLYTEAGFSDAYIPTAIAR